MSEVDTEAALSELSGNLTEETPTNNLGEPDNEVTYYELPYEGQNLKLPMTHPFSIKHNGTLQDVPLEKLFNAFRQTDHLQSKMAEYKKQQEEMEQLRGKYKDYEERFDQYSDFDRWAQQNPQEWEKLHNLYQNKDANLLADPEGGLGADHPLVQKLADVTSTLSEVQNRLNKYEERDQEIEQKETEELVKQEIKEFGDEYPGLDLDQKDLDGISLRARIIQFGAENNYPTFQSAAFDYKFSDGTTLRSKLKETASMEGRNSAVKAVKQDNARGVLGRTSTPTMGQSKLDPRRLSEEDRFDGALSELQAMLSQGG